MATYTHKRGTTFSVSSPLTLLVNGQRQLDFTGWQAHSQVRTLDGRLIATLVTQISTGPQGPQLALRSPDNTAHWPRGPLQTDVLFITPAGEAFATSTAQFAVIDGATHLPP